MSTERINDIANLKQFLQPFIKPREQVNYIRRILALELGSYTVDGPIQQPLALNDELSGRSPDNILRGPHKEYVEALRDNVQARRRFEEVARRPKNPKKPERSLNAESSSAASLLAEHTAALKLKQALNGLLAIQSRIQQLIDSPAALRVSLDLCEILKNAKERPSVPREIINSFDQEGGLAYIDPQVQIIQLEKIALRARLNLRREERACAEAKLRNVAEVNLVSKSARLQALGAVRIELIRWIEMELSKASTEERGGPDGEDGAETYCGSDATTTQTEVANLLGQIQYKYEAYIAARDGLLELLTQTPHPSMPPIEAPKHSNSSVLINEPTTAEHLLLPYFEALLSQSRLQKALIVHKSHISTTLLKEIKGTHQILGRLADESQLLPAHPMQIPLHRRSTSVQAVSNGGTERPGIANHIRPWLFAIDAAKVATLETVAENVETGQVALDSTMNVLHGLRSLLGVEYEAGDTTSPLPNVGRTDIWLYNEDKTSVSGDKTFAGQVNSSRQVKYDPWARLHGSLGLISHDRV